MSMKEEIKELARKQFYPTTDTRDIEMKSIGVHNYGYDNRGLSIQIRHNGEKDLFNTANIMSRIIAKALNDAIIAGFLILPEKK